MNPMRPLFKSYWICTIGADAYIGPQKRVVYRRADVGIGPYSSSF